MKITLQKIKINNFKGVESISINPEGRNLSVMGRNGVGKTSISDAFRWLIHGKDSKGRADFEIKPTTADGCEIHDLETWVECSLAIDDDILTLRREYREAWDKHHTKIMSHKTSYFVDGIQLQRKVDYDKKVSEIFNPDIFRIVTDPKVFATQKPEEIRKVIFEMFGDIAPRDIIHETFGGDQHNPNFVLISNIVATNGIESHKKQLKGDGKKIDKKLVENEIILKDLRSSAAPEPVDEVLKKKILEEISLDQKRLSAISNGTAISEKKIGINNIQSEILRVRNEAPDVSEQRIKVSNDIMLFEESEQELKSAQKRIMIDISELFGDAEKLERSAAKLREKWDLVNNSVFTDGLPCVACGMVMPTEKALEKFNLRKSESLKAIAEDGSKIVSNIALIDKKIDQLNCKYEHLLPSLLKMEAEILSKKEELRSIIQTVDHAKIKELTDKKIVAENELAELEGNAEKTMEPIKARIAESQKRLDDIKSAEAEIKVYNSKLSRIATLEKERKVLLESSEEIMSGLSAIDLYEVKMAEMMELKVNSQFDTIRFQLFEKLVTTGELVQCCKVRVEGILYTDLNHGKQVNSGLELIEKISEFYGLIIPIVIDDANLTISIRPTCAQQIKLIVAEVFECNKCHFIGLESHFEHDKDCSDTCPECGGFVINESNNFLIEE